MNKRVNKNTISRLFITGLLAASTMLLISSRLIAEDHKQEAAGLHDKTHDKEIHDEAKHEESHGKNDDHGKQGKNDHEAGDMHKDDHQEKGQDEHDHKKQGEDDGHGHGEAEAAADVELSKDHMQKAGIKTMRLEKQSVSNQISALSEVKLNQYKTIKVSPPITTRVEKRHVRLGDQVKKGQLLVTLHTITSPDVKASVSADMLTRADINASIATTIAEMEANIAQARGELEAANATWNRLRSLGKDAIAGKRLTAAKIARNQAASKLRAYQQSRAKIKQLGKPKKTPPAFVQKHYKLYAEQSGMVIKDDFVLGQVVNPEDVLFMISDMKRLWVEANIKPNDVSKIRVGSKATIDLENKTLKGKVISIGRLIDEKTRTLPVRIEINTAGASLYPGQFVKTRISAKSTHAAITVPAEAVLRGADGDWMLFVQEKPGRFVPKEVEIVENLGDTVIIEGVDVGTTIVSKGAFFVQSELSKSGFSVHNH